MLASSYRGTAGYGRRERDRDRDSGTYRTLLRRVSRSVPGHAGPCPGHVPQCPALPGDQRGGPTRRSIRRSRALASEPPAWRRADRQGTSLATKAKLMPILHLCRINMLLDRSIRAPDILDATYKMPDVRKKCVRSGGSVSALRAPACDAEGTKIRRIQRNPKFNLNSHFHKHHSWLFSDQFPSRNANNATSAGKPILFNRQCRVSNISDALAATRQGT